MRKTDPKALKRLARLIEIMSKYEEGTPAYDEAMKNFEEQTEEEYTDDAGKGQK